MNRKDLAEHELMSLYIACITEISRHRRTIAMYSKPSDFYPAINPYDYKFNGSKIKEHQSAIDRLNDVLDNVLVFVNISDVWKE